MPGLSFDPAEPSDAKQVRLDHQTLAAEDQFLEFQEEWGAKYPAIVRLWENTWDDF